jgi:hypothetical protein
MTQMIVATVPSRAPSSHRELAVRTEVGAGANKELSILNTAPCPVQLPAA